MRRGSVRLLIAAKCVCVSACVGSVEQVATTNSEQNEQQASQPAIHSDACAKLSELKIGMTTSQVLSTCGQKPIRTSEVITRDKKKVVVLVYENSRLQLTDDKLIQISNLKNN